MISLRSAITSTIVVSVAVVFAACADSATSPTRSPLLSAGAASHTTTGGGSSVASPLFPYGIVAIGNLTFTGNAGTDSYVGTYGSSNARANGNVATGGNLTLTGNPQILGTATVGGTFRSTGNADVTGGVTHATAQQLAALTAPPCPSGFTPAAQLPGISHGSYNPTTGVLRLTGNSTLTLSGATQYHFSQVVLTGNSNIQVQGASQPVTIFVDNLVDLTGGGLLNSTLTSANLAIVGCGPSTTSWKLTGNAQAYFCVYAPNHDLNLTGNSDLFGALVGRNVSSTGNGKFHYDESATSDGACGGPPIGPDLSAGPLQLDVGNGPQNITSTSPTVYAGQPVSIVQWVSLAGGPAPATATCTITVTQGSASTTLSPVTVSMSTGAPIACQVPYTFATAGAYTISSVISVPDGQTDPNPANNTQTAVVNVTTVTTPTVRVAVTSLDFSESDEAIANQVFAPSPLNAAADTIHSGAVVTYRAAVTATAFLDASSVTATCSAADNTKDVTAGVVWHTQTVTLTPSQPTGYCSFDYTITESDATTSHPHTVAVSVSTAPTQNTAGNNAALSGVVTVPARLPKASVAISELDYSDAAEGITSRSLSPLPVGGAAADSVHSGDVATYSAVISASMFQNTAAVPAVTCSATVDGQAVTTGWVNQTVTGLTTAAPTGTCSFTKTFNETDNQPHPHTIAFAITTATTGSFTNTATTGQSATGTINSIRRADVQASALQILDANGQPQPLSALAIKQGTSATLQFTVTNTSTSVATSIDCGALLQSDGTSPTSLSPQTLAPTTVALGAAGSGTNTGVCKYSISAPAQLALINIPLMATATTTANFPLDPVPANNTASGALRVASSGKFTVLPTAQSIDPIQQWTNPTYPTTTAPIDPTSGILSQQQLKVSQLALLVIPTQAQLGVFSLETTVYTKTAAGDSIFMGTGTTPVATGSGAPPLLGLTPVDPIVGGSNCTPTSTIATPLGIGSSGLAYQASICASPSGATNQQITVSYNLTSGGVSGANALLFRDNTYMKIKLRFNLDPTATAANDSVTATIQVPMNQLVASCTGDPITGATPPYYCQSSFLPAVITTP